MHNEWNKEFKFICQYGTKSKNRIEIRNFVFDIFEKKTENRISLQQAFEVGCCVWYLRSVFFQFQRQLLQSDVELSYLLN